jgi:glycosyltransferase involved in cell wall biosynthesis
MIASTMLTTSQDENVVFEPKIRLLYMTAETWPTFRQDVATLFGKCLPHFGVQTDLVAGATPGADGFPVWMGGKSFLCDVSGGRYQLYVHTLFSATSFLIKLRPRSYQFVQVRDRPVLAAIATVILRMKGLPLIYWMSYPISEGQIALARERGFSSGFMKWLFPWLSGHIGYFLLYQIVLRKVCHVFVQSPRMMEDLVKKGINPEKLTPVPMGVDIDALLSMQIVAPVEPRIVGRRVLVYLGTLDRPRKIELLFEMMQILRIRSPKVLLVLIGDTEDDLHRDWLVGRIAAAGVEDSVLMTGWLPMLEGWRFLKIAEVALSPFPRGELLDSASPTKVPEYMAFGIPVVCNDNPDQQEIIQKSGGGLCVQYTPIDFAAAVSSLLAMEEGDRVHMGELGRNYIRRTRDYTLIAEQLARRYSDILAN